MEKSAKFKYVRVSPRKVQSVVKMVKGAQVQAAIDKLNFCNRAIAPQIIKLIKSAISNVSASGGVDVDNLYVENIRVDQGPTMKRWRAKARGMAGKVNKRMSHITVELKER